MLWRNSSDYLSGIHSENAQMARKQPELERGARSKAVRAFLKAHPSASPAKVVAALQEQGLQVSLGLVSVIKYSKRTSGLADVKTSAAALFQAKKLADRVGGIRNAQELLNLLEQLR